MSISLARDTVGCLPGGPFSSQPPTTAPQRAVESRFLGPDLVRAGAALLVVYLHACVPYLQQGMPGLVWAVEDHSSRSVSTLFWSIEIFIMPLFLVVAGYFAYRSWAGGGGARLIASRTRRLLLPLLAAGIILLPLDYYLWIVGWVIDGEIAADRLWKLKVRGAVSEHLWGLGHLWFLQYVFLYCVVLAAVGRCSSLGRSGASGRGYLSGSLRPWIVAMLTLPFLGWMVLAVAPEVVFGFQHAFLPVPSKWFYSGTFFIGGVAIAIFDPQWRAINRLTPTLLAGGVLCGWAAVTLGQWAIERSDPVSLAFHIGPIARVVLAAVTVAAAWGITLGMIGGANRIAPALARWRLSVRGVSYLAGAGLWIYLVHHPLVALIQIDLKLLFPGMAPLAKSLITTAVAVGLSLVSYELVVRLGHGRRRLEPEMAKVESAERTGGGNREVISGCSLSESAEALAQEETVRRRAA